MISVAVHDDDRDSLLLTEALLADAPEIEVVARTTDERELARLVRRSRPDVVLVGHRRGDPAAVLRAARATGGAAVVLHSSYPDELLETESRRFGAQGYLRKGAAAAQVRRAIEAAHRHARG